MVGGKNWEVVISTLILLLGYVLHNISESCSSVTVIEKVSITQPENDNPSGRIFHERDLIQKLLGRLFRYTICFK